jgi:hypothetical protein
MSNALSDRPVLPRDGVVFFTHPGNLSIAVAHDLCKIASFLQHRDPYRKLRRYDDWWEHDGLFFGKGDLDLHGLFELVGTPRTLLASMPGDHRVFIGVEDVDRAWYLRFFVDWDERDENIIGEYSIALNPPLLEPYEREVKPILGCKASTEDARQYYERIKA